MKSPELGTSKQQWRQEQVVALLYGNAKGAIFGSVTNIAIVAFVLSNIYPNKELLTWFLVAQGLNAYRWWVLRNYTTKPEQYPTSSWLWQHRILTFASGCIYGLLAIFFFSPENPLYQMMIILLVAGMGAAAVGTHGMDMTTFRLFLYACIIPLQVRTLCEMTEAHITLAIMLMLLIAIMLRSAEQTKKIFMENIDMSYSLHYRATHDGLVGLLNRDEFQNLYLHETANYSKEKLITAMMFIDLDNFKTLNDTYGHQAGDDALVEIGEIIRASVRRSDIAARFGGDEFMVLIRSEHLHDVETVARNIMNRLKGFEETRPIENVKLGASIGISYTRNSDAPYDTMLRAADQACYRAKSKGKGIVELEEVR